MIQGDQVATKVDRTYSKGGYPAVNLDMKRRAAKKCVSRLQMAEAGARAGHREEAIKYLEQAFELRDPLPVHVQRNPNLDSLHSEPAYWAIVKKMGMQPLQQRFLSTFHSTVRS